MTIREVLQLTRSRGISGVPVVDGSKVVGIVTHRDLRFEEKLDAPVSSVMTPQQRLITVRENAPKEEVLGLLHKHRIEKLERRIAPHPLESILHQHCCDWFLHARHRIRQPHIADVLGLIRPDGNNPNDFLILHHHAHILHTDTSGGLQIMDGGLC